MAVTYYRGQRQTVGLARCANDIVLAVSAGERWRGDVRAATGMPTLTDGVFTIPLKHGTAQYRFDDGLVERKKGGTWLPFLKNVKVSRMMADSGKRVTSWRWEIELRVRRDDARVHPLFTFQAVPGPQNRRSP